jgi:cell division protein FtsN
MGNIPFRKFKAQIQNILNEQQPFDKNVHRHLNTGMIVTMVVISIIIIIALIAYYKKHLAKLVTNRLVNHSSKPSAPREPIEPDDMKEGTTTEAVSHNTERLASVSSIAEQPLSVNKPNGNKPSWIKASSTRYNPLTGDVLIVTKNPDTIS